MEERGLGRRWHGLIEQEEANQPPPVRQKKKEADQKNVQGIELNRQVIAQVQSEDVREDGNGDQSSQSCQPRYE